MPAGSRLRPTVLAARQHLVDGRQKLRALHNKGLDGVQVCARFTTVVDGAITQLYDAYLAEQSPAVQDEIRHRLALVAHGGYGRRQQAPYSDVDVMLLYGGKLDALVTDFAGRLTRDICDTNVSLGHSVRSPAEAVQQARTDAQIGTSLIESRLLLGSDDLFRVFLKSMQSMVEKRTQALAQAFIAERRKERAQYGETVYILEPNVKRSRGGLRDLHLHRWLWYVKTRMADPDRLHVAGVLSKFDYRRLVTAQSFLLRVRNEMHFHAGELSDALTRSEQLRLAEFLQYQGRNGLLPVEQFMRDYFHHANHVWHLVHRLAELSLPASTVSRVLGHAFRRTEDDYQLSRREVSATAAALARLERRRGEVLCLLDLARNEGKRIAQDTWYFVYRTAPRYSHEPTDDDNQLFLKVLANPLRLGELLRRAHELGVLEKFVPAFAHARCLLQFNQYHKFTVDEHCIRAVEEAAKFAERDDLIGELYRRLSTDDRTLLHLALLIHDLGKGYDTDHSEVGRRIARDMAARLALSDDDARALDVLVYHHLYMSQLATKYDTTQPQLVSKFVETIGTARHLDLLLLVTCADLAAVGPGVLTSWKIEVLSDLYHRAKLRFEAVSAAQQRAVREAEQRAALQQLTSDEQRDPWFHRQLAALPEAYISRRPPRDVAETLRRLRQLDSRSGAAWGKYLPETDTLEFVAGIDQGMGRAIFSSMAGALTSNRLQILAAETSMLDDGLLLLRYVACEPESPGAPLPARLANISKAMVESIDSDRPPTFPKLLGREQQEAAAALTNLPNEVRIDNELSDESTIVEVFTIDRRGLLYRLARALHDLQLVIRFAKIGTYLDQVVDVFYVTERDGAKPQGEERLAQIRASLYAVIGPPGDDVAPRPPRQ